jgi:ABC-2 type transport system ATP-binding protein
MYAIETDHLTKYYSDWRGKEETRAVKNLNLKVKKGEIFGFLGPNGAGKTTTVKMLLGLIFPTSGEFTLLEEKLSVDVKKRIGYLPEEPEFPPYLTAMGALEYYATLYGLKKRERSQRIHEMLSLVSLKKTGKKKVDKFSKGMKQRLGIAQALVADPKLVILDEPTSGLDPQGRKDVKELLLALKKEGTTVFLNSHILSEVEKVCDRVGIIKNGEIISVGTIKELTSTNSVEIHAEISGKIVKKLEDMAYSIKIRGEKITVEIKNKKIIPDLAEIIITNGGRLKALIPQKRSLEDTFLEVVGQ